MQPLSLLWANVRSGTTRYCFRACAPVWSAIPSHSCSSKCRFSLFVPQGYIVSGLMPPLILNIYVCTMFDQRQCRVGIPFASDQCSVTPFIVQIWIGHTIKQ
jgi:hypothetical protein